MVRIPDRSNTVDGANSDLYRSIKRQMTLALGFPQQVKILGTESVEIDLLLSSANLIESVNREALNKVHSQSSGR